MEDVPPPLPLDLPLLLVKPPVGLSTPEIFKALDLSKRSAADPREVRGAGRRGGGGGGGLNRPPTLPNVHHPSEHSC